jgi:hypothetical protein
LDENAGTVLQLTHCHDHSRSYSADPFSSYIFGLPYDPASGEDLQIVEGLEGWSRIYRERHIYVQKQSKQLRAAFPLSR